MSTSTNWPHLLRSRLISRPVFLILALLCLASDATNPPSPIAVPVDTNAYYGYDGSWSGILLDVGRTADQLPLTVFPNTAGQETWVIGPGGCDGTFTCEQKRGGLYMKNESSTWKELGLYQLNFDPQLGDSGIADYGLEYVGLTSQPSPSGQTEAIVNSQVVGILNSTEFWLGELGLGVRGTEFNGTDSHLTFLSTMVEEAGLIPSHSYGYTAGAFYRSQTPASLTLGGVDTNRFVHNPATFPLGSRFQPVVAINEITVSCAPDESTATDYPSWVEQKTPLGLLNASQADYFTIDSSLPFLWLPEAVCDSFADALNLTYNDTLGLYFFGENSTTPDILTTWNMTFLFSISDFPGSSNTVQLELSYNALNLELSYPYPNLDVSFTDPPVPYFPLRKAIDNTQYTIGRAFLQETYLAVDYERGNFSISQATFSPNALTNLNLEPITRPANSNYTGPPGTITNTTTTTTSSSSSSGLSTGAKAGIGVGAVLGALLVMGIILYFCVLKPRKARKTESEKASSAHSPRRSLLSRLGVVSSRTSSEQGTNASELLGDKRQPIEISADSSNSRFELPEAQAPIEMAAADVPPTFYASNRSNGTPSNNSRNDPRNPAELEPRSSLEKNGLVFLHQEREEQTSPIPPAYEARRASRFSHSISPNSPHHSHGFGTMSSGEPGISPVGGGRYSRGSSDPSNRSPTGPISPISPNDGGTMRFPQLHGGGSGGVSSESGTGTGSSNNSNSLRVPYAREMAPERSMSRSSRFVEEGLDETAGRSSLSGSGSGRGNGNGNGNGAVDRTRQEDPPRPPLTQRFSWED